MNEVMLGKELHPDRVIAVEKLYDILNKYGAEYSFPVQHGIENGAFAVVRCRDCANFYKANDSYTGFRCKVWGEKIDCECYPEDFCSYGERVANEQT